MSNRSHVALDSAWFLLESSSMVTLDPGAQAAAGSSEAKQSDTSNYILARELRELHMAGVSCKLKD